MDKLNKTEEIKKVKYRLMRKKTALKDSNVLVEVCAA